MKIAAIADIHGNIDALEAVLEDVANQAPDVIVNLGDVLSGPLFPAQCAELLMPLQIPTVRGNHERQLLTTPQDRMSDSDRYTSSCLHPHHRSWIASFPETISMPEGVLLVHGTPHSDLAYLLETVEPSGVRSASSREVEARLECIQNSLILCGHSHVPRSCALPDGRLIVNPGSVGLQAYESLLPHPHKMETQSPHARYAIVEGSPGAWTVELRAIRYNWERAAQAAEQRGRLDWASALRTGFV